MVMIALCLFLLFQGLMILAAACDLFTMTIPNRLTAALGLAFLPAALLISMPLDVVGLHVAAGLIALIVAFGCFAMGWIGGGDAKFFAATALWLGPMLAFKYVLISTVLGGFLTLALLAVRQVPLPERLASQGWLTRLHDARSGIPYGIALAIGGLIVAPEMNWLANVLL